MQVAVIGAGLSGLSIAKTLTEYGHQVSIFEKSRGRGGRLATKRLPWAHINIGAQYFTVRDSSFRQTVAVWQQENVVRPWRFTPHRVVSQGLIASPDDTERFIGQPHMNSIAHWLSRGLKLHFNTHINRLLRQRQQWTLSSADGQEFSGFDWLIITIPAEQARALTVACSDIATTLPSQIHQACWALALATRGHVPAPIQGIFGDATVSWVSRLSAQPGWQRQAGYDDVWMLHFAGSWSQTHSDAEPGTVAAQGQQWLQQVTDRELTCAHTLTHRWRYAQRLKGITTPDFFLDQPQCLALVGSWCAGGRVEGAYLSARAFLKQGWLRD